MGKTNKKNQEEIDNSSANSKSLSRVNRRIKQNSNNIESDKNKNEPFLSRNFRRVNQRVGNDVHIETMDVSKFNNKYDKKKIVDFDLIILIGSFNRYNKLKKLIDQIYLQDSNYSFKIILCDDGSTDKRYSKVLSKKFPEIEIIKNEENNGKLGYYKTMTNLWGCASKYSCHGICHLDDDFIVCNEFINNLFDVFFRKKEENNKIVSVYFHKTSKENHKVIDEYRVDGGVIFDSDFVKALNFKVDKPNVRYTSTGISSGVWRYISDKIKGNKLKSFRTNNSLIRHDGNEDSKMHGKHRKECPINTYDFKDEIRKDDEI